MITYWKYLKTLDDFDFDRLKKRPEFYIRLVVDGIKQMYIQQDSLTHKYHIHSVGLFPSNSAYHIVGNTVDFGCYDSLDVCIMQFLEFVSEFASKTWEYTTFCLYFVNLSCFLELNRNQYQVSYISSDFPYMHIDFNLDKTISSKRVIYKGKDLDNAKIYYRKVLKEFISYVM